MRSLSVTLGQRWIARLDELACLPPDPVYFHRGSMVWLGTRLYEAILFWSHCSAILVEGLLLEMLSVVGESSAEATTALEPKWMRKLEETLRRTFTTSSTVSELAEGVGVHAVHLSRTFRRFRGISIGHYVHRLRIEEACRRLAEEDPSLAELAVALGFADQTHFTRVFRQVTGTTPGSFRAIARRNRLPA